VPSIASQPGRIPAGRTSEALLSGYDLFPTLVEYAGIRCDSERPKPGRSFRGVLDGRDDMEEAPVVVFDEYGPVRMVRTRDWKYVHRHPDGPHELFDLAADPGERTNRIADPAAAAMRESLARRLDDWFCVYVDPIRDGVDKGVTGCGQLGRLEPGANTAMFADSHLSNTDWDLWVPASDEQTPSYAGKGESDS